MVDGVTLKVEGLAELERKMRAIGPKLARTALRSSLNTGTQIIKKDAQARAPVKTGLLASRAIYVKRTKEKGSATKEVYIVGVRQGHKEQKRDRDAYYWKFIEFGTKFIPAVKFLQSAFESKKYQAFGRIKQKLKDNLDKIVREK